MNSPKEKEIKKEVKISIKKCQWCNSQDLIQHTTNRISTVECQSCGRFQQYEKLGD